MKYSINLYDKDGNFIAQYPNLDSFELATRNALGFLLSFNAYCERNDYKYNKGYCSADVKTVSIVKEE